MHPGPRLPPLRRAVRALALLPPALLAAACSSIPDVRADTAYGVVLAPDAEVASRTADLWEDVAPRLEALGAGLRARPVDVVVFDSLDDASVYGGFDARNRRVLLDAGRRRPAVTLAHELVHAYEPSSWERLPAVVREGLADWLAARAVPGAETEIRASRAISLASWATGGLPVPVADERGEVRLRRMAVPVTPGPSPLEALRIPHGHIRGAGDGQVLKALYGMGFLIVSRAGIQRLERLSLVARARGPGLVAPADILVAARLDADAATWLPAIEGLVARPSEQDAVRRVLGLPRLAPGDPDGGGADVRN